MSQFDPHIKAITLGLLTVASISCSHLGLSKDCQPEKTQLNESEFVVQTLRHTPQKPHTKTLLIIPPTGSTNLIDKSYATEFCKNGYQVFILDSWTGDQETVIDFEIHQRFYSNAQKAISLVLQNTNTSFVGLLGTSVGGLHASVAASLQDSVDAVFTITAGTPIAEVVVYSAQEAMQDLNQRRQTQFHTTSDQDQIDRITKVFRLEPTQLENRFQNKRLGMSIATLDTVVPVAQQIKLQNFWKPEVVIKIKNDHFWGILKTWMFHTDEILAFFNKANREKTSSQKVPKTEH